jgi:aminopeptidase N
MVAGLERSRNTVFTTEKRLPGIAVVHNNLTDMTRVLNQLVYQKGGWVLHMLHGQIGNEKFWAGIRDYYRRYRDSSASTADFRHVMEEASGADLGWFFQQWLYRAGSPTIEGGWTYDAAAKKVRIELQQTQPGDAYRLPLQVRIGSRIEKLEFTMKQQRFEFAAESDPATVVLDPENWFLMEVKFTRSAGSQ